LIITIFTERTSLLSSEEEREQLLLGARLTAPRQDDGGEPSAEKARRRALSRAMDQGTESSSITFYDEGIRRDSLAVESVEGQEAPPPSLRVVAASTRIVNYWAAYDDSDHEQAQKEAFKYLSHVIVRYNAHLFLARTGKTWCEIHTFSRSLLEAPPSFHFLALLSLSPCANI
jgi:hypothetical protein